MNSLADRMRARRAELNMTQSELATKSGLKQSTISGLESGTRKSTRVIGSLAHALQCNALWLEKGLGPKLVEDQVTPAPTPNAQPSARPIAAWDQEEELPQDEYFFIPRLDIGVSAGAGAVIWEIDVRGQRQAMTRAWAEREKLNTEKLVSVRAKGDSMSPRIQDGDSLTVDTSSTRVRDNSIYVFVLDDEWYVKRLIKQLDGGLLIKSDNTANYKDVQLDAARAAGLHIIGRVVAISGPAY